MSPNENLGTTTISSGQCGRPRSGRRVAILASLATAFAVASFGCGAEPGEQEQILDLKPAPGRSVNDALLGGGVAAQGSTCAVSSLLGGCETTSARSEFGVLSASTGLVFRSDLPTFNDYPDILLDAAESTSGWSGTTRDTAEFKQGTSSLRRTGTLASRFWRTFATPVDVSKMRFLTFWYYVDDPTKLGSNTDQQVEIGSAGTYDRAERNWPVGPLKLHRGWNHVVLDIAGARHRTVNGVQADLTRINWFRIYHQPTASITTRIDQIVFTNRQPNSLAFSQYLDRKETLIRHPDGSSTAERAALARTLGLALNDPRRQRECRSLRLARQVRAVSQYTLDGLAVGANGVSGVRVMEAYVCGELTIASGFDSIVNTVAKDYLTSEVSLVQKFATRFGIADHDAAETAGKLFELDQSRILETCGTVPAEVGSYLDTGAIPPGIVGPNPLFRNCQVSSLANLPQEISVRIGAGRPLTGAGDRYAACWNAFASQASECSNPYAASDPMGELNGFSDRLGRIPGYANDPERKESAIQIVADRLAQIESLNFQGANDLIEQHNDSLGYEHVSPLDSTHARPEAPQRAHLDELHRLYDDSRGQATVARTLEEGALSSAVSLAQTDPDRSLANRAAAETYHENAGRHENDAQAYARQICEVDPQDEICTQDLIASSGEPPDAEPKPPATETRCAEFNVGGTAAWYETPTGTSGDTREVNSIDRMEHCLCEVFDRQYADLPQFQAVKGVNVNPFCPDPAERVMHECTQPGWDDGPASPQCRFGLVSPELDHSVLTARLCNAMRSTTCPDPLIMSNGECSCFNLPPPTAPPPVRTCQNAIQCGPDSILDTLTCGCRPLGAPRVCAGNVLTSTQPLVNFRNDIVAVAGRPLLSVGTDIPLATRAVTKATLTNGNRFDLGVYNPYGGGAATGTAEVRCTNLQAGVSNYLVDRVAFSNIGSGTVNNTAVVFSPSDITQCFGANQAGASNLEVAFKTAVPRLSLVADGAFGRILDPVFPTQPCTIPTLGPAPRPAWNMSTGQVLFNRPITYPVMNASGLIFLPFTEEEPVYFAKSYAPGSLSLMDDSSTPASSQVVVTREGTVSAVTLQLRLRGDWLAGRFNVTLIAPNGTEVYDASGLGTSDDNEANAESFDGGIVIRPSGQVGAEGTWTLLVRDVGGNDDGLKSGDLYAWSLNFHDVDTWDFPNSEQGPPDGGDPEEPGDFPAGWSCNGSDGFEDFPGQFYGDGACDCGCGAMDSDCASNNISACEYEFCAQEGDVNPSNIATCL